MARLFLGLGSNLGNKQANLQQAIQLIEKSVGHVLVQSAFYTTKAWGFASDNEFLNDCIAVETPLDAHECLQKTQAIERQLGRTHKSQNGEYQDRLIDIDILFYDQMVLSEPDLCIPHPLLQKREFVLRPLAEIAPDFRHPQLHKTCRELLASLEAV